MIKALSPAQRGWALVSHIPSLASSRESEVEPGFWLVYSKGTSQIGVTKTEIKDGRWMYDGYTFVYKIPEGIYYYLYGSNRICFDLKAIDPVRLHGFSVLTLDAAKKIAAKEVNAVPFTKQIAEYLIHEREQYWNQFNHDYSSRIIPMINI